MKWNIFILGVLVNLGCQSQIGNINRIIENSVLIDLPIDYKTLSLIKGDSLQQGFKKELSVSQYYLNIKGENKLNKPLLFQNLIIIGRVDLSIKYDIAIFKEDYNLNDAIYFLGCFNKNGKLLSLLKIIDRTYIPSVSSTINKGKVIYIKEEYEDHVENYYFILETDGIFKRTSYSEEKI